MKKQLLIMAVCAATTFIAISQVSAGSHVYKKYNRYESSRQHDYRHKNHHGYKKQKHCKEKVRVGFSIGGLGVYFNTGTRYRKSYYPYRRPYWRRPNCRPRYTEPIVRYIEDDYRLYQPPVRGHVAFLQRWSSYENRWVNIKEHPSIY